MNEPRIVKHGRIASLVAPRFIHDRVPYFTFSLTPSPQLPVMPEDRVFYVDPDRVEFRRRGIYHLEE